MKPKMNRSNLVALSLSNLRLPKWVVLVLAWPLGLALPIMVYGVKHFAIPHAVTMWQIAFLWVLCIGGLMFSAPTCQNFVFSMLPADNFRVYKSWGFVILMEGLLIAPIPETTMAAYIPLAAIGFLSTINGLCMSYNAVVSFARPAKKATKKATKRTTK